LRRFQKISGIISAVTPIRTLSDGIFYRSIKFTRNDGQSEELQKIFFTHKLVQFAEPGVNGVFYFWNSHCYGFKSDHQILLEDIDGVRHSFYRRDLHLLIVMTASIVLLPVGLVVMAKKIIRSTSRNRMAQFLTA